MDFPDPYSFTGQQYQGMMQIPPLTPSHSHSAPSEEFTSPPDNFQMSGDQMAAFDYMQQGSAFPGPPTPPNAAFKNKFQQQQQQQPGQDGDDAANRGGSEEDDSITPAQSRRKAQNRAAQRAFRERKERHVKDLEAKLATLEAAQAQASEENERLKRDLAKVSTENEILRATSAMNAVSGNSGTAAEDSSPATTGPMQYQPTDFYSTLLKDHTNKTPSHRVVTGDDGERLFAAGATWDYILGHDLYKRGLVNIEQVSERLKYQAKCDGQGPVFAERDIVAAIEQSVASGSDDLL